MAGVTALRLSPFPSTRLNADRISKERDMIKGSCACGAVRVEIDGTPQVLSYCHCSRCRKTAGAAAAFLIGKGSDVRVTAGQDAIKSFSPEGAVYGRFFCGECGSALGDLGSKEGSYAITASILDEDPGLRPAGHIFTGSKPDWYEICDGLDQYEGDFPSQS